MTIVVPSTVSSGSPTDLTYLSMAQRLRRKCRVKGSGPTAVNNQSEEEMRLLSYINEAYMAILRLHPDWDFLRASCSTTTTEGRYAYTAVDDFGLTDFGYWALDYERGDTFRCYLTATGESDEQLLGVLDYDDWRNQHQLGSLRTSYQRPSVVAAAPDRSLVIGPIPTTGYTVAGDYYKVPVELAAAGDTPCLPNQFHMAIVYRAMMYFGVSEAAPEIYDEGKAEWKIMRAQMEATQLRRITIAGPLA